jgi:hypothetical protein
LIVLEYYVHYTSSAFKCPKQEIFGSGVFAQIRPLWVGDLGARPTNSKGLWFWHEDRHIVFLSAVGDNAKHFSSLIVTVTAIKKVSNDAFFNSCHKPSQIIFQTDQNPLFKQNKIKNSRKIFLDLLK